VQVLSEEIPPSLDAGEGNEFLQPSCPKCGSLDVRYDAPLHGVQLAVLFVAPLPMPAGKKRWMCETCGAQWEVVPEEAPE